MLKIREATKEELSTEIETIKYSLVVMYCKLIERKNLNDNGVSTSFGSMDLSGNIITMNYCNENKVDIHKGWRKILWNAYRLNINPVLIEED